MPLLIWTGPFSSHMNVSGDASLLFFQYPRLWLAHSPVTSISNTIAGYNPQPQFIPFVALLWALQCLHLNSEGVLLGAVLGVGYSATAHLTMMLAGARRIPAHLAGMVAGTIVVCAPLLAAEQWTAILPELFWIGLLPLTLIMFIHHQRRGGLALPIAAAILLAIFAPAFTDVPGFLPVAFTWVALVVCFAMTGVFALRPSRAAMFAGICVVGAVFWLGPWLVGGLLFHNSTFGLAASSATRASSAALIGDLAAHSSISDAAGLRGSYEMAAYYAWPHLGVMEWSQRLWPIGYLPALAVMAGAVQTLRRTATRTQLVLPVLLILMSAVTAFMITVQVIPHGAMIVAFLIDRVPGLDGERNFYVVWAIPFCFVTALAVGVWTSRLLAAIGQRAAALVAVAFVAAFVIYDAPFLGGAIFTQAHASDAPSSKAIDGLAPEYLRLLDRLENLPPGAVLTLPLREPAWSFVPSSHTDLEAGAYLGLSPIYYLSGRSDFDGIDSFQGAAEPGLAAAIRSAIKRQDLAAVARAVGALGVRYVVLDEAALTQPFEMTPLVVPPTQTAAEWSQFVATYAWRVVWHDGPYSLRELDPSVQSGLAGLVGPHDAVGSDAYVTALASGLPLAPPRSACSVSSSALRIVSWSAEHAEVAAASTPAGCAIHLLVAPADGWRAIFTPEGASSKQIEEAPKTANAAGLTFEVPEVIRSGRYVVDLTYRPATLIPVSSFGSVGGMLVLIACAGCRFVVGRRRGGRRAEARSS